MNGRESGRIGIVARTGRTGRIGNLTSDIGERRIAAREGFRAGVSAVGEPPTATTEGADVKLARTLSAIGLMAALAGCKTCWIDRDDQRPMKNGSVRDCLSYGWWGECFHPHYHCGPPDGIRDHISVKKAAIKAANRALSEQNCGETSRDFEFGFQQAYIDVANGGNGALPAVPPPRYWAAPYRTTWGHNKARDWFSGYEAGASSAKCCMPANTISVPTSVYRGCDNRLAVGLDGGSFGAAPVVNTNYGWAAGGTTTHSPSPMMSNPYPANSYSPAPYSMTPYGSTVPSPAMSSPSPMMMPPAMPAPPTHSVPGSGWSNGPSPAMPSYPPPTYSAPYTPPPAPSAGGYSIPVPQNEFVNPPMGPMSGPNFAPPAPPSPSVPANNPWGQFRGISGFGFKPEGASR